MQLAITFRSEMLLFDTKNFLVNKKIAKDYIYGNLGSIQNFKELIIITGLYWA